MGRPLRATLLSASLVLLLSAVSAQVWPYTFTATLNSDSLALPVETEGSATAVAVLTGNQLVVTGVYQNMSSPVLGEPESFFSSSFAPGGADIRTASSDGDNQVVPLSAESELVPMARTMTMITTGGTSGTFSGAFTLTEEQLEDLENERYIVQLYTENNRKGELKGQLVTEVDFDFTAEDQVGAWKVSGYDYNQFYPDGTWAYLTTLHEAGKEPLPGETWALGDGIWTFSLNNSFCRGTHVAYMVHTKQDTAYEVIFEPNSGCRFLGPRFFHQRVSP